VDKTKKEILLLPSIEGKTEKELELHSSNLMGHRYEHLNNKIGSCPHCSSKQYCKYGKDKGRQCYS